MSAPALSARPEAAFVVVVFLAFERLDLGSRSDLTGGSP